jgi:hypothetical protein
VDRQHDGEDWGQAMKPPPLYSLKDALLYAASLETPSHVNEDKAPYSIDKCEPAGGTPTLQALCWVTDAIFEVWHDLSQPLIRMKRVRGAKGFAAEIKAMNEEMHKLGSLISNLVVIVRQLYAETLTREGNKNA